MYCYVHVHVVRTCITVFITHIHVHISVHVCKYITYVYVVAYTYTHKVNAIIIFKENCYVQKHSYSWKTYLHGFNGTMYICQLQIYMYIRVHVHIHVVHTCIIAFLYIITHIHISVLVCKYITYVYVVAYTYTHKVDNANTVTNLIQFPELHVFNSEQRHAQITYTMYVHIQIHPYTYCAVYIHTYIGSLLWQRKRHYTGEMPHIVTVQLLVMITIKWASNTLRGCTCMSYYNIITLNTF